MDFSPELFTTFILSTFFASGVFGLPLIDHERPRDDMLPMASTVMLILLSQIRALQILKGIRRIECPWYIKPRSLTWYLWSIDDIPASDPVRFRQFFRVSPTTFLYVCELVRPDLTTNPPAGLRNLPNRSLTVERQVAVAIWRFATGDNMAMIAELFGISKQSVSTIIWRFVQSLNRRAREHLSWPVGQDLERVKQGFFRDKGLPNCCGAIGATHFLIDLPPGQNSTAYGDYKHGTSVRMQGIVDSNLRFLDVFAGWPGSIHDSRLFRNSRFFYDVMYAKTKLNGPTVDLGNGQQQIGEYILGNAVYPAFPWLIVPFPGETDRKREFNDLQSSAWMSVERAFSRLRGIWRLFSRTIVRPHPQRLAATIYAACLLHNIVIDRMDVIDRALYENELYHPPGYGGEPPLEFEQLGVDAATTALLDHLFPATEWEANREERPRGAHEREAARNVRRRS